MRPIGIAIKGVTVLDDVHLDFTSLTGDIVAITGPNGAGKSSFMESIFACLYRQFPSRPAGIYTYCHGRDARILMTFEMDGHCYESRLLIDAENSKMEGWLYDSARGLTLEGINGKVGPFDEKVAAIAGPDKLVLASAFSAQNHKGSFLDLGKLERKQLFIRMLGLEKLQQISDLAKQYAKTSGTAMAVMTARKSALEAELRKPLPDLEAINHHIDLVSSKCRDLEERISLLTTDVATKKVQADSADRLMKEMGDLERAIKRYDDGLIANRVRQEKAQSIIEGAEGIRAAADVLHTLVDDLEKARTESETLRSKLAELMIQQKEHDAQMLAHTKQLGAIDREMVTLESSLGRTKQDSEIMTSVPCRGEGDYAGCRFLTRAVEAASEKEQIEVRLANLTAEKLQLSVIPCDTPAPNSNELENLRGRIKQLELHGSEIQMSIKSVRTKADMISSLDRAEVELEELKEQRSLIETERAKTADAKQKIEIEWEEASTAMIALTSMSSELTGQQHALRMLRDDLLRSQKQLAQAEAEYQAAVRSQEELDGLEKDLKEEALSLASWSGLDKAFGPMGIQSLEIDAAGPSVSALANELLFSCFGPRFSIRFVTQVPKQDGGYKDEFDIEVQDSERNRSGSIDDISGGEKVIVSEAVGLAIALFNSSKSGISWRTLFRDEVTGALDDDNSPRYISMLRRARELGHFERVYFIAHQPRLWELSDSQIQVQNGKLEIIQ
jgi:DNA repair protein SbcC/Rad50